MKRTFFRRLCAALVLCLLVLPVTATQIDPDRLCSLTLYYTAEDTAFSGLSVSVYRVARLNEDGTYALTGAFEHYPVNIHGITSQNEWKTLAAALWGYTVADQIDPTATAVTDEAGTARFDGLETGLYLVSGANAADGDQVILFQEFMIYLPTPGEDGSANYDMEAKPKFSSYIPPTEYRVTKLWKDEGTGRPNSVTVDIYRDNVLHESVTLKTENDWTYRWITAPGSVWTVAERDVPEGYQVTLRTNGHEFILTNTTTTPPDPPDTGDTFPLYGCIMAMSLSGLALILLGLTGRRERRNEAA